MYIDILLFENNIRTSKYQAIDQFIFKVAFFEMFSISLQNRFSNVSYRGISSKDFYVHKSAVNFQYSLSYFQYIE